MLKSWVENIVLRRVCVALAQYAASLVVAHHFGSLDAEAITAALMSIAIAAEHKAKEKWPFLADVL